MLAAAVAAALLVAAPAAYGAPPGPCPGRLSDVEARGCRIGYREAEDGASDLTRAPASSVSARFAWVSGYVHGRARSRLEWSQRNGERTRIAGTVLLVLAGIGGTMAPVGALFGGMGEPGFGAIIAIIAGPMALVETAIGVPLLIAGIELELRAERDLGDLDLAPGRIPLRHPSWVPGGHWTFHF